MIILPAVASYHSYLQGDMDFKLVEKKKRVEMCKKCARLKSLSFFFFLENNRLEANVSWGIYSLIIEHKTLISM